MPCRLSRSHALLLAVFLALALLGARALQDSPWHDHSQDIAKCALCHLQAAEPVPPVKGLPLALFALAGLLAVTQTQLSPAPFLAHFRSRAPPALSRSR